MTDDYRVLLSQVKVGDRILRNRIVKTAAGSRYLVRRRICDRQGQGPV